MEDLTSPVKGLYFSEPNLYFDPPAQTTGPRLTWSHLNSESTRMTAVQRHWQKCRRSVSQDRNQREGEQRTGTRGASTVLAHYLPAPGGFQCQSSSVLSSLTLWGMLLRSHHKSIKLSQGTDEGKVWSPEDSSCLSMELEGTARITEECVKVLGKCMMCAQVHETRKKQTQFLTLYWK